jgi:hypothetical protein
MGWTESPPYFCATTETVTDMTNWRLMNRWKAPPHRLEALANTRPPPEAEGEGTPTLPVTKGPKPPFNGIPTSPFAEAEGPLRRHSDVVVCRRSEAALHHPDGIQATRKRPLQKVDLFVDDFIELGQGNQAALSHICCMFPAHAR